MPVTLNPTGAGTQDDRRSDMFIRLDLSAEDKSFVVYRKFVSNDPMSDFLPQKDATWSQTSVGMPKALLELARRNATFTHRISVKTTG